MPDREPRVGDVAWVVSAHSGSYSDYRMRIIAVYDTQADAERAVQALTANATAAKEWVRADDYESYELPERFRLLDPVISYYDAADTTYSCESVSRNDLRLLTPAQKEPDNA